MKVCFLESEVFDIILEDNTLLLLTNEKVTLISTFYFINECLRMENSNPSFLTTWEEAGEGKKTV